MGTSSVKTSTKSANISQTSYKDTDDKWLPVGESTPLPVGGDVRLTSEDGTVINPATEDTVSQLVMAITNAIDSTAYDLNAAAFSEITNITNDYELDSVELNFSTGEAKTIAITSSDGTLLWGGDVDTTAANQGYLTTAKHFYIGFNHRGFDGGDNITVTVTQLTAAGTMDCILRTKSGTNSLLGNPHVGWVDTEGTEFGFQRVGDRPRISTVPYDHEISAGNIAGHVHLWGFGERGDIQIDARGADIWLGDALQIPFPNEAVGEQMTVVSSSAQDDGGGTGVSSIKIDYIDSTGGAQTEEVMLDGTTPVNTNATDITFVNHVYSTAVGSNGVAVGNIDIYKVGDSAIVYNRIVIGGNKSLTCAIRVPNGVNYFIQEWHCSVTGNKPTAMRLRSTDWDSVLYDGSSPVFIFKDTAFLAEGNFDRSFTPPLKVPCCTTIKVSAWTTQAGAFASASFNGYYE